MKKRDREKLETAYRLIIAISKDMETLIELHEGGPSHISIEDHRLAMDAKDAQIRAAEQRVQGLLKLYERESAPTDMGIFVPGES